MCLLDLGSCCVVFVLLVLSVAILWYRRGAYTSGFYALGNKTGFLNLRQGFIQDHTGFFLLESSNFWVGKIWAWGEGGRSQPPCMKPCARCLFCKNKLNRNNNTIDDMGCLKY